MLLCDDPHALPSSQILRPTALVSPLRLGTYDALTGGYNVRVHFNTYRQLNSAVVCRYGPLFVGVVLNIILYGIMITQTYLYFNVYKK